MAKNWLLFLAGVALLAACAQVQVEPQPTTNLNILNIDLTPELAWLSSDLNTCAGQVPGTGLLVDSVPSGQTDPGDADALLAWSSAAPAGLQSFELGAETLLVVANPANPLESLTTTDLADILTLKATVWSDIAPDSDLGPIQAWVYPAEQPTWHLIQENILQNKRLNPEILVAPGAEEMRAAVSATPGAIGFLPSRWLDASVKALEVSDLPQGMTQPILAITHAPPTGALRDLLLCVGEAVGG
jgi:hypothetical protein